MPKFGSSGKRGTGIYRLRPTWFGFLVIEEKVETIDGSVFWARPASDSPIVFQKDNFHE